MAAAPVQPTPPAPEATQAPLSEGARIIDTFIAPSKTFTDLRRSAAWWAPFLLMVIVATALVYTAGQKIGFRKLMENQMQSQPKAQARLDNLPARPAQQRSRWIRERKSPESFLLFSCDSASDVAGHYACFLGNLQDCGRSRRFLRKVVGRRRLWQRRHSRLSRCCRSSAVVAGVSPDSFSFQNPIATNPGYFMDPEQRRVSLWRRNVARYFHYLDVATIATGLPNFQIVERDADGKLVRAGDRSDYFPRPCIPIPG